MYLGTCCLLPPATQVCAAIKFAYDWVHVFTAATHALPSMTTRFDVGYITLISPVDKSPILTGMMPSMRTWLDIKRILT